MVAWAAILPIERLVSRDWSVWVHAPLMAISLAVLAGCAALGGIALAELHLQQRQAGKKQDAA